MSSNYLVKMIQAGDEARVKAFLERGHPCDKPEQGRLPIHHAARKGNAAILKLLLDANSSVINAHDDDGFTPLHLAVMSGRQDVVELLVAKKARIDEVEKSGRTPLYFVVTAFYYGSTGYSYVSSDIEYMTKDALQNRAEFLMDNGASLDACKFSNPPKWAADFMKCRKACRDNIVVLKVLLKRRNNYMRVIGKDMVQVISDEIWATRHEDFWLREEPTLQQKSSSESEE